MKFHSSKIPDSLPVFPVKASLLLPGGQVTHKIFEPRYVNMLQDALASGDRLIGVVMTDAKEKLYDVGCAGRVTSFEEMVDGSFLVVLTGYCRFKVGDEVPTMRKYRRFVVDCSSYQNDLIIDLNPLVNKDKLIEEIKRYSDGLSINMDWDLLPQMPAFNIITFFCMHLPFSVAEMQALLEAETVEARAGVLLSLMKDSKGGKALK